MGRVHEALHRLFTRDFCPLPSLDPRPLPNVENVFTRYTRENMDRSLTSEQEWPPLWRTNRCLCSPPPRAIPPFYLIHYWQLTAEQKSRSKLEIDRARWAIFFTARGVQLWDFDRSWFAALTKHYSSPLRLEEIYTWTRLEGRLHRGRVQRTIYC